MKHLDTLLGELQHPVDIVQAWCDEDKDRAVVACIKDLFLAKDGLIFEVIRDACDIAVERPTDLGIADIIIEMSSEIYSAYEEDRSPELDYDSLYRAVEHIINDRIDLYNAS